jgi:transposase
MKHRKLKLSENDYKYLNKIVKKEKEINRARILLLLDKDEKIENIADILDISLSTVAKIKKRYLDEGLESAVYDRPRSGQHKKYEVDKETEIIALACTDPPEGCKRWTLRLLAETLREKEGFESVTRETVRIVLKKAQLDLGSKKCGA